MLLMIMICCEWMYTFTTQSVSEQIAVTVLDLISHRHPILINVLHCVLNNTTVCTADRVGSAKGRWTLLFVLFQIIAHCVHCVSCLRLYSGIITNVMMLLNALDTVC